MIDPLPKLVSALLYPFLYHLIKLFMNEHALLPKPSFATHKLTHQLALLTLQSFDFNINLHRTSFDYIFK